MYNIFYGVLPIFLIALMGNVIKAKWLTAEEFWRGLEKLSFFILFPSVLFLYSVKVSVDSDDSMRLVLALVISISLISFALIMYQTKKPYSDIEFTTVFQGATRYNNYIFFGLGSAFFGNEGLSIVATISPYMMMFTSITSVMVFVHYISLKNKKEELCLRRTVFIMLKSIGLNPFILASISGMLFRYFGFELDVGIEKTMQNLANSALTIGILIVGARIKVKLNMQSLKQILFTGAIKLIIMPVVTCIVLMFSDIEGTTRSVGILFSCLPCASSSYIFSKQLGGNPETMSATITFSTVFSLLSLSVLVYILG